MSSCVFCAGLHHPREPAGASVCRWAALMPWPQNYDPLGNPWWSTVLAAIPVITLLSAIALFQVRIHVAAGLGLLTALLVAVLGFGMPMELAAASALYGAAYGFFPIVWIILNLIFLYRLTVTSGRFDLLRRHLGNLAPDPRIQLILVAFCFGAFFEGAAGFGAPVAITAAILIQLGFSPLHASGLSLIANTAPVAFGSIATPIVALNAVTGLDIHQLSAMVGRQLPPFSLLIPAWIIVAYSGWRGLRETWGAALVAGGVFALVQFLVSNYHGPWLVDILSALASAAAVLLYLKLRRGGGVSAGPGDLDPVQVRAAYLPWAILCVFVFVWGVPWWKDWLNQWSSWSIPVPGLHEAIVRVPPVVAVAKAEKAIFVFNPLAATGTGVLIAAMLAGLSMGFTPRRLAGMYMETVYRIRHSILTIAAMLALGYVTKYSGADATLGLTLARTGYFYPFFGTMLGWLGVALTGSDTASNVLFGNLQTITAQQTGVSPLLMAAANSSGGVMGKMIDAQSIVVASTATNAIGQEGRILRFVFIHSLTLAILISAWVFLQARVWPFTLMVVH